MMVSWVEVFSATPEHLSTNLRWKKRTDSHVLSPSLYTITVACACSFLTYK